MAPPRDASRSRQGRSWRRTASITSTIWGTIRMSPPRMSIRCSTTRRTAGGKARNPNAYFDTNGYLAHNPEVAAAGVNPLDHYDQSGWKEGRDPSPLFDTNAYLAAYPDVAAGHIDPLVHFLQHGILEGRTPHGD